MDSAEVSLVGKAVQVRVGSEIYGDETAIATEVTNRRIVVKAVDPPPIGSIVTVHFPAAPVRRGRPPRAGIVARAEVKVKYRFAYGGGVWSGCALRVLEWLNDVD